MCGIVFQFLYGIWIFKKNVQLNMVDFFAALCRSFEFHFHKASADFIVIWNKSHQILNLFLTSLSPFKAAKWIIFHLTHNGALFSCSSQNRKQTLCCAQRPFDGCVDNARRRRGPAPALNRSAKPLRILLTQLALLSTFPTYLPTVVEWMCSAVVGCSTECTCVKFVLQSRQHARTAQNCSAPQCTA